MPNKIKYLKYKGKIIHDIFFSYGIPINQIVRYLDENYKDFLVEILDDLAVDDSSDLQLYAIDEHIIIVGSKSQELETVKIEVDYSSVVGLLWIGTKK